VKTDGHRSHHETSGRGSGGIGSGGRFDRDDHLALLLIDEPLRVFLLRRQKPDPQLGESISALR
jgi:hypothetical protein